VAETVSQCCYDVCGQCNEPDHSWCNSADVCESSGEGGCKGKWLECPAEPEPTPAPAPEPVGEGGRCCFHMSSCPDDLTADNEVAGCVETTNFCSFSEARCVSPQNTTDGCDGTNTGTENVYCPVGESLQQTKAKLHAKTLQS
jgi:hypothetical protein